MVRAMINRPYEETKGMKMIDRLEEFCLTILRKIKLGKLADLYEQHKIGRAHV